jgi:hypothetical protein
MNGPFLCSSSTQAAGDSNIHNSSSSSHAGSEQQLQLEDALKLPQMGYSHLVYVCYKP